MPTPTQTKPFVAYHPGLSSIEAVAKNYEHTYSDHVPFLASTKAPNGENVRILSWNVLQTDSMNGLAPLGKSQCDETDAQRESRHKRIATSLAAFALKLRPDFIALQEITAVGKKEDVALFNEIMRELSATYDCAKLADGSYVDPHGCITLHNKLKFDSLSSEGKKIAAYKTDDLGGTHNTYQSKNSKTKVRIASVHPGYDEVPLAHENHIINFLEDHSQIGANTLSIVVGDFNCHTAPLDTTPKNITTSLTPSIFRGDQLQGACSIDACFSSVRNKNGDIIRHQNIITHLDPYKHQTFSNKELAPIDTAKINPLQKEEIETLRPMMCIDSQQRDKWLTIQEKLRNKLGQPLLDVRPASDLNNNQQLCLIVEPNLAESVEKALPKQHITAVKTVNNAFTSQKNTVIFGSNDLQNPELFPLDDAIAHLAKTTAEQYTNLKACLQALRNQIAKQVEGQSHMSPQCQDAGKLADAACIMVQAIVPSHIANDIELVCADADKDKKMQAVKTFEQTVSSLPSFALPTWKKAFKITACVTIAAIGAIVGIAAGAIIEGAILAILSAPAGGIAGIVGALHGAWLGGVSGWTLGLLAAGAIGLTATTTVSGFSLFGANATTPVQKMLPDVFKNAKLATAATSDDAPALQLADLNPETIAAILNNDDSTSDDDALDPNSSTSDYKNEDPERGMTTPTGR